MDLKEIAETIRDSENFIILTHYSADGDAIGSSFAMSLILQKMGKKACVILEEEIPKIYSFLPGEQVHCLKKNATDRPFIDYTAIVLDAGDLSRLGGRLDLFKGARKTLNIDHHITNPRFAGINWVDTSYSSVGEMIYEVAKELDVTLDRDIADCIYVAVITDTGGFKHANTNSRTHLIVSELLKYDVDTSYIAMQVFDKISKPKIMLIRRTLDSLCFYLDTRVAVMKASRRDFDETGADAEDTEGLVDMARNIEDVEIAVMISEIRENRYKVNLRSNTDFDVSTVAAAFGGGGHKKAAGCTFTGGYDENLEKIIGEIKKGI